MSTNNRTFVCKYVTIGVIGSLTTLKRKTCFNIVHLLIKLKDTMNWMTSAKKRATKSNHYQNSAAANNVESLSPHIAIPTPQSINSLYIDE